MGCAQSGPNDVQDAKSDDTVASDAPVARAAMQRRRLSVALKPGELDKGSPLVDEAPVGTPAKGGAAAAADQFCIVSARSKKGYVPYNSKKQNQDAYVVHENLQGDAGMSIYGVFDGHGEFGELVSGFVRDHLPEHLEQQNNLKSDPVAALLSATASLCDALTRTSINRQFSGTTAVYGLRVARKLYVANIGDSRCIMVRRGVSGTLEVVALSYDHKPDSPKEKERILRAGGRVQPLPGRFLDHTCI